MAVIEDRRDPAATERILRSLPSWFGIEKAIRDYAESARTKPSYFALDDDGAVVGVALVEQHFEQSAELYLLAVDHDHRRQGIGAQLVARIELDLRNQDVRMLQVKTVGESFAHDGYGQTRAFYRSVGFLPVEELTDIGWDGPTVIMIKCLDHH